MALAGGFPFARTPSTWFWEERSGWYVNLDGQRRCLGEHTPGSPTPKKSKGKWNPPPAVVHAFHELMASRKKSPPPSAAGITLVELFEKYLSWCEQHREPSSYDWYRDHLQSFLNHHPAVAREAASALKPFHVVEWADAHPDWSPAYRRGAIVAVQRPMNWAVKLGHLDRSPIQHIEKPKPQRRESHVTPAEFADILASYPEGDAFRLLLQFAWDSGARPQEIRLIEARHLDLARHRVLLPPEKAKGKRKWRVIYLTDRAEAILRELAAANPDGILFRNEDGRPWSRFAIANRFDRLHLALGIKALRAAGVEPPPLPRFNRQKYASPAELKAAREEQKKLLRDRRKAILKLARQHGSKVACYDFRHGFATRKLVEGHDVYSGPQLRDQNPAILRYSFAGSFDRPARYTSAGVLYPSDWCNRASL